MQKMATGRTNQYAGQARCRGCEFPHLLAQRDNWEFKSKVVCQGIRILLARVFGKQLLCKANQLLLPDGKVLHEQRISIAVPSTKTRDALLTSKPFIEPRSTYLRRAWQRRYWHLCSHAAMRPAVNRTCSKVRSRDWQGFAVQAEPDAKPQWQRHYVQLIVRPVESLRKCNDHSRRS